MPALSCVGPVLLNIVYVLGRPSPSPLLSMSLMFVRACLGKTSWDAALDHYS